MDSCLLGIRNAFILSCQNARTSLRNYKGTGNSLLKGLIEDQERDGCYQEILLTEIEQRADIKNTAPENTFDKDLLAEAYGTVPSVSLKARLKYISDRLYPQPRCGGGYEPINPPPTTVAQAG